MSSTRSKTATVGACLTLALLMRTQPADAAAAAPNISATNVTANSFTLVWSPVSGAANYRIEYANDSMMSVGRVQTAVSGTSLVVSGRSPSTTYWFRGYTYSSTGSSSWTAPKSVTTLTGVPLTAPTITVGTATLGSIPISWNAITGAVRYDLTYSKDATFATGANNYSVTTTSYSNSVLMEAGTTYYFRVRAADAANNLGPYGTASGKTLSGVTGTLPAPTGLSARGTGTGGFYISWNGVSGATSYTVSICQTSACTTFYPSMIFSVNTTYKSTSCMLGNVVMYTTVQACTTAGCGAYSAPASALCQ